MADAAAPGADGMDADHRQGNCVAGDFRFCDELQLFLLNERQVEAGTAHVGHDEVFPTHSFREHQSSDRAAGRTGQESPGAVLTGRARRRDAAVALNHLVFVGQPVVGQELAQVGQIPGKHRAHERIDDRGAGAFVLADLRRDFVGSGYEDIGIARADQLRRPGFVGRVLEREQEADADSLHPVVFHQVVHLLHELGFIEQRVDGSVIEYALYNPPAQVSGDDQRRLRREEVPLPRTVAAPHFQRVAKSLGGQQRGSGAAILNDRIGRHGSAVHELPRLGQ